MDLKEWQKGLTLCFDNIFDLFQEANLLMSQKRWSRGIFLFITAYEELATAFFILGNYTSPKPKELKKLFRHPKKLAVSSFLTFPAFGNMKILQDYFKKFIKIDFNEFNLKEDDIYDKEWYKFGDELQKEESLSYWRKCFLYLSISPGKSTFFSPRIISKSVKAKIARDLYYKLSLAIPLLQLLIFKLLSSKSKEVNIKELLFDGVDRELLERLNIIYELYNLVITRSIEKIRSFDKANQKLKDLIIIYISDPNKIKDDQFRIEILNEALKDIAPEYSKIWEDEKKKEDVEMFTNFVKKLNPDLAEKIKSFYIILNKIAKEDLTPEDLHKFIKKPI